ncbi:MAG: hypothetical protein NC033_02805 [Clostridiales bacterium]|nr:hypothetical protein [Clostridiales bacterium]
MKYSLLITQVAEGERTVTAADAEGDFIGGVLVLCYRYDGAEYKLEIAENAMAQSRDGDFNLSMKFIEGQTTAARLSDGQSGGEFPVCTQKLAVRFDGFDCRAECDFSYGACGEVIKLSVVASVLQ